MTEVRVAEAKARLSELLDRVERAFALACQPRLASKAPSRR